MIKQKGDEYCIFSESGKELSCHPTEDEAKSRLKEIEALKHMEEEESEKEGGEEISETMEILHTAPTGLAEKVSLGDGGWNDLIMDGEYTDMHGLPVKVTPDTIQEYLGNFNEGTRGQDVPITFDHPERGGIAAGWIRSLRVVDRNIKDKTKKVLQGLIDWTPTGTQKVEGKEYRYISSEILPKNVLKAASLVNFPAVKGMNPVGLGEDEEGYKHIYLMGGDLGVDEKNQETFINTLVEKLGEKIQTLLLADKEKEMPKKGKTKKHLPGNEEGKQWCIFMDGKQTVCGPDEAWANEQLNPKKKEDKPIKASEKEQGGENKNMEEDTTKLVEDKIAEAVKPLAEENKELKAKLDESTTNLADVVTALRLKELEVKVEKTLKLDKASYTPAVSEALLATVLAEPKDYEEKVFALLELIKDPKSIVSLEEIGTGDSTPEQPIKNTAEYHAKADKRAQEIRKETGCEYKLAAKQAYAELAQLSD